MVHRVVKASSAALEIVYDTHIKLMIEAQYKVLASYASYIVAMDTLQFDKMKLLKMFIFILSNSIKWNYRK